jgi:hypothetical protein
MAKMSTSRILLGGIVAGIVADTIGYIVDGKLLASDWSDGMAALGHGELSKTQFLSLDVLGIVTGIVLIWIYAALLPRFGPGAFTALYAAVAVWTVGVLIPDLSFMWITGLFPNHHLVAETAAGGLVELVVGGICGAILYKDQPPNLLV